MSNSPLRSGRPGLKEWERIVPGTCEVITERFSGGNVTDPATFNAFAMGRFVALLVRMPNRLRSDSLSFRTSKKKRLESWCPP